MLEIVGIVCVFWAVFMLGRLWERDHPKVAKLSFEQWQVEDEKTQAMFRAGYDPHERIVGVRPSPYDWSKED